MCDFFPVFRLFEIGSEIHGELGEVPHIAGVLYNAHGNEQDFFEMKRIVECIFPAARLIATEGRAYEHPWRTAEFIGGTESLAVFSNCILSVTSGEH